MWHMLEGYKKEKNVDQLMKTDYKSNKTFEDKVNSNFSFSCNVFNV